MRNRFTDFWKGLYSDRFKRYLVISLIILGVVLVFTGRESAKPITNEGFQVDFFYLPGCSHCENQRSFNQELVNKYPEIDLIEHDASKPEESALLLRMLKNIGVEQEGTFPVTIMGNQTVFFGWDSVETTGEKIEKALQECLAGNCPGQGSTKPKDEITLPIIGKTIKISNYSLPALSVILGLVDGFNPCAMWVLVYLISIVMTLKDRKRIWLLCGTFVFASGVLYFFLMTAWLNAFLLIGYSRPVMIVIGLVALGAAGLNIRELIKTRGAVVCNVVGAEDKKKTESRIEKVVSSPLTLATVLGIIGLAFVINSIEFVCSAALPAIFTYVLSISHLTAFQHYGYILLYDFFFMLDDLIIFSVAAFAASSAVGTKYEKYSKPIGSAILLILGLLLLFAPNLLR